MKLSSSPPLHLTYCLNVHPGETWRECFNAIRDKALVVRNRVAPNEPFGLGLRLGRRAAAELSRDGHLDAFKRFLVEHDIYVFTINGFPYGRFHATSVKQDVYRPDWRSTRRLSYTTLLADILAALLPEGLSGSISTVPGSYKAWANSPARVRQVVRHLARCALHLRHLHERTGKLLRLALEPEPDCLLETTEEAIRFFSGPLIEEGAAELRRLGVVSADCESVLRSHIGVCFDTCHLAVQFENLAESLQRLRQHGTAIPKIQLSAALQVTIDDASSNVLRLFCDPVYLHQVKVKGPEGLRSFNDLNDLLAAPPAGQESRIHFHVPLFWPGQPPLQSTVTSLSTGFFRLMASGASEHVEIETYTFDVLPKAIRPGDVIESIAREYAWVLDRLSHKS